MERSLGCNASEIGTRMWLIGALLGLPVGK